MAIIAPRTIKLIFYSLLTFRFSSVHFIMLGKSRQKLSSGEFLFCFCSGLEVDFSHESILNVLRKVRSF